MAGKTDVSEAAAPVEADKDKRTQDGSDPDGQHKPATEPSDDTLSQNKPDDEHHAKDASTVEEQAQITDTSTDKANSDAGEPSEPNVGTTDTDIQPSEAQSPSTGDTGSSGEQEGLVKPNVDNKDQEGAPAQAPVVDGAPHVNHASETDGADADAQSDGRDKTAQIAALPSSPATASLDTGKKTPTPTPTPAPAEVENGTFADADDDGIQDRIDECRNDAEDRDGFEDHDGCPDVDNDDDGVPDADDRCPNGESGDHDQQGCHAKTATESAEKMPAVIGSAQVAQEPSVQEKPSISAQQQASGHMNSTDDSGSTLIAYKGAIRFRKFSDRLAYGSLNVLKASLPTLKANTEGKVLVVKAYSFAMTTPKQNVRISSERAMAVKKALIGLGWNESDVVYAGLGRGTNEQRKRAVGDGLIEFHAVNPADAPFELSQIVIDGTEVVSVMLTTSRPIEKNAVDIRSDGPSVAMIRFRGAQVKRGWITSKNPLIKRALLHPSVEMMPGGVIRIRWAKDMPQPVLNKTEIAVDGQAIKISIPKW